MGENIHYKCRNWRNLAVIMLMKKFFGVLFIIIGASIILVSSHLFFQKENSISKTCFNKKCFLVDLAISANEQEKGLMYKSALDNSKGMLFIFDQQKIHPFWMKNTLISLDIIWIDDQKKVVFIKENALPCLTLDCPIIYPEASAKYVLEINAGLVKNSNIKIGDTVDIY